MKGAASQSRAVSPKRLRAPGATPSSRSVYCARATRLRAKNDGRPLRPWWQLHSTNTIELVNPREIKRRTGVVGIFPSAQAALRLIGAVLEEQHEQGREVRRYFSIESMALLYGKAEPLDGSLSLVAGEEVFVI